MESGPLIFFMVHSSLHEATVMQSLAEACTRRLDTLKLRPAPPGAAVPSSDEVLVVLPITGGTESLMKKLREAWDPAGRRPVWVLAIPHHSSLAAAMEFIASLHNAGIPGRIFYFDPQAGEDEPGFRELADALEARRANRLLHEARLGLIGLPSDWLLTSPPDAELIRNTWGPELVYIPVEECLRALEAGQTMDQILKVLITKYRFTALTLRCFDLLAARDVTACVALARLNDGGIPAGCEGDIPSALGLLWIRALWNEPAWMANPSRLDRRANRLTLAHCTVPLRLTSSHTLCTHFESGRGTAIAGDWASEEVTLFRIGGPRLQDWWIGQGRVTGRGCDENLCRTQVTVEFEQPSVLPALLQHPLGNHLLVIPGKRAAPLEVALSIRRQLNP
jgi:L-fucose isomerase-like protein